MKTTTQSCSSFLVIMSFAKHADDQSNNQPVVCCVPDVCTRGTDLIDPRLDTLQPRLNHLSGVKVHVWPFGENAKLMILNYTEI